MKYWFKPARFWNYFAAYYPASKEGWVITVLLLLSASVIFWCEYILTSSLYDAVTEFGPWGVIIMMIFDSLCFRRGQYPHWWKKSER